MKATESLERNCICVGGPVDGRRVVIPDRRMHYYVVEKIGDFVFNEGGDVDSKVDTIEHRYDVFPLHPATSAVALAYSSMTPTEIMERLLDGYRSETTER